jgi:hypothetical protein
MDCLAALGSGVKPKENNNCEIIEYSCLHVRALLSHDIFYWKWSDEIFQIDNVVQYIFCENPDVTPRPFFLAPELYFSNAVCTVDNQAILM